MIILILSLVLTKDVNAKPFTITVDENGKVTNTTKVVIKNETSTSDLKPQYAAYKILDAFYNSSINEVRTKEKWYILVLMV